RTPNREQPTGRLTESAPSVPLSRQTRSDRLTAFPSPWIEDRESKSSERTGIRHDVSRRTQSKFRGRSARVERSGQLFHQPTRSIPEKTILQQSKSCGPLSRYRGSTGCFRFVRQRFCLSPDALCCQSFQRSLHSQDQTLGHSL